MTITISAAADARGNFVFLRGRLAATAVHRDLPSGDVLTTFRVTVARPAGARARVDSLECVTMSDKVRSTLERLEPGRDVEITGALQRRFWRSPTGPASRYSVEVDTLRTVKVGPPTAASRARKRVSA